MKNLKLSQYTNLLTKNKHEKTGSKYKCPIYWNGGHLPERLVNSTVYDLQSAKPNSC